MKKILIIGAIILGSIGFSTSALAAISEQQAKDIVKKEAPNGQITKFKLDRENGRMVYEIEVMDGNIERDYEIDAETGAIVKLEQEQKNHGNNNSVNNPKISLSHLSMILSFITGATLSIFLGRFFLGKAIWLSSVFLVITLYFFSKSLKNYKTRKLK